MMDYLADIWPIVFIFIAAIFSFLRVNTQVKANPPQAPAETLEDEFPMVELNEPVLPAGNSGRPKPVASRRKTTRPAATLSHLVENSASAPEKRGCKIAIKGKSEAKKAFIYSEIFNKKY